MTGDTPETDTSTFKGTLRIIVLLGLTFRVLLPKPRKGDGVFFIVWEVFAAWYQAILLLFALFVPRVCDCIPSL